MDSGSAVDKQFDDKIAGPEAAVSGRTLHKRSGRAGFPTAFLSAFGPGILVAVGYIDPGNWATDISAGAAFGFDLLVVVLSANFVAILAQSLSIRLALGAEADLATACHRYYPRPVSLILYIGCQIAIIACDLAEVVGTAIGLNLLFGLPVMAGAGLSLLAALAMLALQRSGRRPLEIIILLLVLIVALCLFGEIALIRPPVSAMLGGFIPHADMIFDANKLYLGLSIVGATVMPHNLYLHGALILRANDTAAGTECHSEGLARKRRFKYALADLMVALSLAFLINAAILIVAAAAFHLNGRSDIRDINQAYHMLSPLVGASMASTLFGLALLAAGQSSTVTATLAGQVIMEGFLQLRWPPWLIRLATRMAATLPVLAVIHWYGSHSLTNILVFSQVVLSMQLPFALVPLIHLTSKPALMGKMAIGRFLQIASGTITAGLIFLNLAVIWSL